MDAMHLIHQVAVDGILYLFLRHVCQLRYFPEFPEEGFGATKASEKMYGLPKLQNPLLSVSGPGYGRRDTETRTVAFFNIYFVFVQVTQTVSNPSFQSDEKILPPL